MNTTQTQTETVSLIKQIEVNLGTMQIQYYHFIIKSLNLRISNSLAQMSAKNSMAKINIQLDNKI